MSEDAPAVPTPWVLDISVLVEVARGDTRTMTFVQELDARGRPLVIPVLAVTGASLDIRSDEAAELLEGLERLKNAMTAPLRDAEQAGRRDRQDRARPVGRSCGRGRRRGGLPDPHARREQVAGARGGS